MGVPFGSRPGKWEWVTGLVGPDVPFTAPYDSLDRKASGGTDLNHGASGL